MNPPLQLDDFRRQYPLLICIDSDGCALDTMEVKNRHSFIPNTIKYWQLEPIEDLAWDVLLFAHLYSQTRGLVRYSILPRAFDLLEKRIQQDQLDFTVPEIGPVRDFVADERYPLNLPGLQQYRADYPDPSLDTALDWANAIDEDIKNYTTEIPVFPLVRETLEYLQDKADVVVISMTPTEQLANEWAEHDLLHLVDLVTGQEAGAKDVRIHHLLQHGYALNKTLMMGDSPGDLQAATATGVRFYPVLAKQEAESWQQFHEDALAKFLTGQYQGEYEQHLITAFNNNLPEDPPWA